MNSEEQVDRVLGSWLADGPTELSDRSVAAIVDQLDNVKQRRSFQFPRTVHLPRLVPALGAAAVIVVAAVFVLSFYSNSNVQFGPGGSPTSTLAPAETPAPTNTPAPTATPDPTLAPDDPRQPFLGQWISTSDSDGGTQTMTVAPASAARAVSIVVTDTVASVCSATPSTMTGKGRIEGDQLVLPTPDYRCDDGSQPHLVNGDPTPINQALRNLTYHYDSASDTLSVGPSEVWRRQGPRPTFEIPPSASPVTPAPTTGSEAEQIIADGTLATYAADESGALLTVWDTCEGQFDTECGHAWRLSDGSQTIATGMVGHGDVHTNAHSAVDGFVLTPACCDDLGFLIAHDGTVSPLSMECLDTGWSTPTESGRLNWASGLQYVDTVANSTCSTSQLGGDPLAQGVFDAEGSLWGLVDNELGPETLTIGKYNGQQWDYHDFATPGGSWTSVMATAGSTVVVLVANLEPEPRPDSLNGFVFTTDGGATWSEVSDPDVLRQSMPFSSVLSDTPEDWFNGYTSMALADPSTVYVADGNGDLWRSTDFSTFSKVEVTGFVSELKSTGDAVIARLGTDDLIRIATDGTVEAIAAR
jgi:hypothetical protein